MGQICTKCGAEAASETPFCASCEAPLAATADTVAIPPASAATKSASAPNILLIVVAVAFGLGMLGLGGIGFALFRAGGGIRVPGPNGGVSVSAQGDSAASNASDHFAASDLGIDSYPGARVGRGAIRMSLPNSSTIVAVYLSDDPTDQVVSFYRSRLGSDATVADGADGKILSLSRGQKERIIVTVTANNGDQDGKTKISIVHSVSMRP